MYLSLIVTFILLMGLVVGSIQNTSPIQLKFLAWTFQMSLTGLIFYAALLGAAIVAVLTLPRLARQTMRKRSFRKEAAGLKQRIAELEDQAETARG
ncbi:MAG: LapA family protein [Thermodesulfobacteriota bacterium]